MHRQYAFALIGHAEATSSDSAPEARFSLVPVPCQETQVQRQSADDSRQDIAPPVPRNTTWTWRVQLGDDTAGGFLKREPILPDPS